MAVAPEAAALRAAQVREGLLWSEGLGKEANAVLDAFTANLGELQHIVAPVTQRTQALRMARENIRKSRDLAEEVLAHLDAARAEEGRILAGPTADFDAWMAALQRLEAALTFLSQHRHLSSAEAAIASTSALKRDAIALALEHFRAMLRAVPPVDLSIDVLPPPPSPASPPMPMPAPTHEPAEPFPPGTAERLRALVAALLRNGEGSGCFRAYCDVRRAGCERAVAGLSLGPSNAEDLAKAPWPLLKRRIHGWTVALRQLVRAVEVEHAAVHAVWTAPHADAAFVEVVSRPLTLVAVAGQAIVASRRPPEKVFGVLEIQELLEAAKEPLTRMLASTAAAHLLEQLATLGTALRREARATLEEFEATVARDSTKSPPGDGTVHPLAAYTLTFMKRVFGYDAALDTLFAQEPARGAAGGARAAAAAKREAVVGAVANALRILLDNLEAKSRAYKNRALAALFLMNNTHYVVRTVESTDALGVVGGAWLERHRDMVERCGEEYQELSWGALSRALTQPLGGDANRPLPFAKEKAALKERWRFVNSELEALHEVQSQWTIPDTSLRRNMKTAILEDFVPLYKAFMEKYQIVSFTKNPDKYIKYQVKDVERMIQEDFFEMREEAASNKSAAKRR